MPSTVGADIAKRMQKLEREVKGAQRAAVNRASLELKKATEAEIKKVAPSMRLSGVGPRGARVGVRYDIKGTRNPTSIVKAYGPLHFIERDTDPHTIAARRLGRGSGLAARTRLAASVSSFGGSARGVFGQLVPSQSTSRSGAVRVRAGKRALTVGGVLRAYAHHPGTRGRRPFEKGLERGTPAALKELHGAFTAAVSRGFR
jgi:hypothetical protein